MSLRSFMYAADALRLEDGIGFVVESAPGAPSVPVQSSAEVRAQNARSMALLRGAMAGVKGAPRGLGG
jgi:hypothetical protein